LEPVCWERRDYTGKFGFKRQNIHKFRLNNRRLRGCNRHRNAAKIVIKEKMYPNLLEDDMVEKLQSGVDPETLVREHITTAEHAPEKRKLSCTNRE
jgi:hypothetical protein